VTHNDGYLLIVGHLYKIATDDIMCRCYLEHDQDPILYESHEGIVGGDNVSKDMTRKFLHAWIWWPYLFENAKE